MFLDRRDFELVQMDTDSLYFALSYDSLEEVVHPELRDNFQTCRKRTFHLGQMECARAWVGQAGVQRHSHDCFV